MGLILPCWAPPFSARGMAAPAPPGDLSALVDLVEVETLGGVPDLFGWAGIEGDIGDVRSVRGLIHRALGNPVNIGDLAFVSFSDLEGVLRDLRVPALSSDGTIPKSRGASKGPQSPRRGRGLRNGAPCVLLGLGQHRRSGPCRFQENQTLLPRRHHRRRGARQTLRRDYPQYVCGLLRRPR